MKKPQSLCNWILEVPSVQFHKADADHLHQIPKIKPKKKLINTKSQEKQKETSEFPLNDFDFSRSMVISRSPWEEKEKSKLYRKNKE